jgi:type III secretory pathway component EscT
LQGITAGLLIAWAIKKIAKNQQQSLVNLRFKITIILFFSFIIGQVVGFGFAQPFFDPLGWFARVWNGDTAESIFGIFSTEQTHNAFRVGNMDLLLK